LRLYGWDPPGLSLGHFQDEARFRGVPGRHRIVRRITGGGAILHGDELTFALTYDAADVGWDLHASYVAVHDAIARALSRFGVPVQRLVGRPSTARAEGWCFARPGCHDLVCPDGRKILGSAQRRVRRPRARVLHHGSLPIDRPEATPFAAAVRDWNRDVTREALARAVADELVECFTRAARPARDGTAP